MKIIKRQDRKPAASEPSGGRMAVSEMLATLDELWRIEHSEDLARLKAKEKKIRELRAAIAALEN